MVSERPYTGPGDFIAGAFSVPSAADGELVVHSPADTSLCLARIPIAAAQVNHAVTVATAAAKSWARLGTEARLAHLRAYQARLVANREPLAETIAWEVGKPLWEAQGEVDAMVAKVDLSAGPGAEYTRTQRISTLPGEIRHRPLGTVAVIGPFNFPGHLPNGQFVPALLAGNTVVFKPSDKAPMTAHWIARCMAEAGLPPGCFNLVQGGAEAGALLANHAALDGVMFTGSAAVGQRILADNVTSLDRVIALELGGKNAALALDDCDIERTARMVAFSAFVTAGQRCTSTSRLIATRNVADALCERLTTIAQTLAVGHPLDPNVFMGPLIDEPSAERFAAALSRARSSGYESLVEGGRLAHPPAPGAYLRPSVHRCASMPACEVAGYTDQELFAPDLAVQVVNNEDDAVSLANRSRYGLSASVFCQSRDRFDAVADALRVGVLHWNRASAGASGRLPFSGVKDSGNHRPAGILAGLTCTYPQAILLDNQRPLPSWPGFELESEQ